MAYNKAGAEKEWLKCLTWLSVNFFSGKDFGLSQRLYSERVKTAVLSELENQIPAMRVRSRPDERHGKHAKMIRTGSERVFLTGKRPRTAFSLGLRAGEQ